MFFARLPFFKDVRMTDDEINTVLARSARSVRRGMFDRKSRVETDGNGLERTGTVGTDGVRYSVTEENGLERTETDEIKNLKRQVQGTKQWMKDPDGTRTNLTESQWLQVRTESFKKWFGDWELAALLNNSKKAWNDNGFTFTYRFSPSVELKERLEDLLGHTVNILQIDGSTVRHIKNEHSDIKSETKKGQKARTAEDIVLIPYLLNNFDEAELSPKHDDNLGNRAITIKKQINGVSVIGTIERGKNGVYVVTNWQIVSAVQMQTTPGRNALSDADKSKIQQDIAKIKTGAENFSKIVDENGEPMKVYHGTDRYGFSVFREDSHFTASREYAARYANKGRKDTKSGVYEVYLSIQNPFDIRNASDRKIFTEYRQGHEPAQTKSGAMDWAEYDFEDFREFLQENYPGKYDGVILDEGGDSADLYRGVSYVPFSPTQIKSATDNVGTFDPENPDIRFSIAEYSQEEQRDIVDVLKPFTGSIVDKSPEEYAAYLKDKGVEIPADDAFRFAQEAARQKMKEARKAADQRRDNWLYENIMEYRWAVEFAGGSDFKIKISPRFEKVEKSGTFWVGKKDKGGTVISLEELAKHVARETGKDELDVEQSLFDFYKDLTKPELRKNYTEFKNQQLAADKEEAKRAFDEFMQQEQFRLEDEAVQILSAGQPLTSEWVDENRKVFNVPCHFLSILMILAGK